MAQRAVERVHRTVALGNFIVNFLAHAHADGRFANGLLCITPHRDVIFIHSEKQRRIVVKDAANDQRH